MNKKLTVFTAFSGYDAQLLALERLKRDYKIEYECVGWADIDRNAIKAHDALFPELVGKNFGDISKIDWSTVQDFEMLTYSSPCQDISKAGQKKGLDEGSQTRSSLLWEVERCLIEKRPRFAIMENVANLISYRFVENLREWTRRLEKLGYTNYVRKLNARDYGVPQQRERVFVVSILDDAFHYYYPAPFSLRKEVRDCIEKNVAERYSLDQSAVEKITKVKDGRLYVREANKEGWDFVQEGSIFDITYQNSNTRRGRVIQQGKVCPTLTCKANGNMAVFEGFINE